MDVLTLLNLATTSPGTAVFYHVGVTGGPSLTTYTDHALCAAVWAMADPDNVHYETAALMLPQDVGDLCCSTCFGYLREAPRITSLSTTCPRPYARVVGKP